MTQHAARSTQHAARSTQHACVDGLTLRSSQYKLGGAHQCKLNNEVRGAVADVGAVGAQSCPTLRDRSTSSFPVTRQLPKFAQVCAIAL